MPIVAGTAAGPLAAAQLAAAQIARWGVPAGLRKSRSTSHLPSPSSESAISIGVKLAEQSSTASSRKHSDAAEDALAPSRRTSAWAKRQTKKWLADLLKKCEEASACGAKKCVWDSGELFGCGHDAEVELTQQLAEGVAAYKFSRVDWWRGCILGWMAEPGNCIANDGLWSPQSKARPIPVDKRRVGAWGFAVRLRVSWASEQSPRDHGQEDPTCFVCRLPRRLRATVRPCAHSFCRYCSRRLRGKPCPLCGTKCTAIEDLPMDNEITRRSEDATGAAVHYGANLGLKAVVEILERRRMEEKLKATLSTSAIAPCSPPMPVPAPAPRSPPIHLGNMVPPTPPVEPVAAQLHAASYFPTTAPSPARSPPTQPPACVDSVSDDHLPKIPASALFAFFTQPATSPSTASVPRIPPVQPPAPSHPAQGPTPPADSESFGRPQSTVIGSPPAAPSTPLACASPAEYPSQAFTLPIASPLPDTPPAPPPMPSHPEQLPTSPAGSESRARQLSSPLDVPPTAPVAPFVSASPAKLPPHTPTPPAASSLPVTPQAPPSVPSLPLSPTAQLPVPSVGSKLIGLPLSSIGLPRSSSPKAPPVSASPSPSPPAPHDSLASAYPATQHHPSAPTTSTLPATPPVPPLAPALPAQPLKIPVTSEPVSHPQSTSPSPPSPAPPAPVVSASPTTSSPRPGTTPVTDPIASKSTPTPIAPALPVTDATSASPAPSSQASSSPPIPVPNAPAAAPISPRDAVARKKSGDKGSNSVLPRLQEEDEDETSGEIKSSGLEVKVDHDKPSSFHQAAPQELDCMDEVDSQNSDGDDYSAFEESGTIPSPMACNTPVGQTLAANAAALATELAVSPAAAGAMGSAVQMRYGIKGHDHATTETVDGQSQDGTKSTSGGTVAITAATTPELAAPGELSEKLSAKEAALDVSACSPVRAKEAALDVSACSPVRASTASLSASASDSEPPGMLRCALSIGSLSAFLQTEEGRPEREDDDDKSYSAFEESGQVCSQVCSPMTSPTASSAFAFRK